MVILAVQSRAEVVVVVVGVVVVITEYVFLGRKL